MSQFEALEKEYEFKVNFCSVSAGQNKDLLKSLNISGLPTFLFYKNGELSGTLVGNNLDREELWKRTEELLHRRRGTEAKLKACIKNDRKSLIFHIC